MTKWKLEHPDGDWETFEIVPLMQLVKITSRPIEEKKVQNPCQELQIPMRFTIERARAHWDGLVRLGFRRVG